MIGVTKTGGHACYFEGNFAPKQWWTKPTLEFINFFKLQENQ